MRKVVYQKCSQCNGSGKIDFSKSFEVPGEEDYNRGFLTLKYTKCLDCNGTGKISTEFFIEV